MYIQGSPVEIQTATRWNLMGRSMTAPPSLLSPAVFFSHLLLIFLTSELSLRTVN
jgi:hypothetical protein